MEAAVGDGSTCEATLWASRVDRWRHRSRAIIWIMAATGMASRAPSRPVPCGLVELLRVFAAGQPPGRDAWHRPSR